MPGSYSAHNGGKRCPNGSYVRKFGKNRGHCTKDKLRANRKSCSSMTAKGREIAFIFRREV